MIFSKSNNNLHLSHLTALDLANETGIFCSQILASLGIRVIRIDKPAKSNLKKRQYTYGKNKTVETLSLSSCNTDKLSITLNINTGEGRELFLRLVNHADIIIETFPSKYLAKKNLDYNHLSQINSRLIMVSITSFGQTSPDSDMSSNDIIACASSGQMYLNGERNRPPFKLYGNQSHYLPSLFAATGILIALRERWSGNEGQHIDISVQETMASAVGLTMTRYFQDNIITKRNGSMHWRGSAGIFPCIDGFIFISFEREWDTLIDWMSAEHMAADLKKDIWNDLYYRRQNLSHIINIISNWTKTHTVYDLFETAQLMRFPWAPIQTIDQLVDNPQLKARGHLPFDISGSRAPIIGEHNYLIFHDDLGFSKKQINNWKKTGII